MRALPLLAQSAAAVQHSVGSIALQPKARREAFHIRVPAAQHAHAPAVTKTISSQAPTNTASPRDAAPVISVFPKRPFPSSATSGGSASALNSAPPAMPPSMGIQEQVTVPQGTELAVQLTESLSSDHNQAGDVFHARLASPVVMRNKIVIPAEAIVQGRIVDTRTAGHFHGDSALAVEVTHLTYNGKTYALRSSPYFKQGGSQTSRAAVTLGTGAGLAAIIGAIVGGGKGAVIGAAIGAGGGSGIQAMSKAAQVQLPAKSMLRFRLETSITVIPSSTLLKTDGLRTVDQRVDNGGPTKTIALLTNSPAKDAVPVSACTDTNSVPVTTDQRGVTRPQGSACDIGAFELVPVPYVAKVQQPINADGSSIFAAKRGVVPVKLTLAQNGVATCSLPAATIAVQQVGLWER